jgi:predicted NAD/FAD-binding protein
MMMFTLVDKGPSVEKTKITVVGSRYVGMLLSVLLARFNDVTVEFGT